MVFSKSANCTASLWRAPSSASTLGVVSGSRRCSSSHRPSPPACPLASSPPLVGEESSSAIASDSTATWPGRLVSSAVCGSKSTKPSGWPANTAFTASSTAGALRRYGCCAVHAPRNILQIVSRHAEQARICAAKAIDGLLGSPTTNTVGCDSTATAASNHARNICHCSGLVSWNSSSSTWR